MGQTLRRGAVVFGFVLALAPLSAFADEAGNSAAIDANKAQQAYMNNLTPVQQGVALGQMEIANARAIAKMLSYDPHAQTYIPNSMQQYAMFCDTAIQHVNAQLANATEMANARPWDSHAQAELANANALSRALWDMIGSTYPGNPFLKVVGPTRLDTSDDLSTMVADDDAVMAEDQSVALSDEELVAADEALDAVVAEDAVDVVAE
jgi:hypothetical protein